MKRLVDACHQRGIAVILDAVYAHAHPEFAYSLVYDTSGEPNPMMGIFAGEFFAGRPGTDYTKEFTRDYFFQLNQYWLREYHVDGFRYDYVPGMYDGPSARATPISSIAPTRIPRRCHDSMPATAAARSSSAPSICLTPQGSCRRPTRTAHGKTGSLDRARDMAHWNYVSEHLAHQLDPEFLGYPK